MLNLQFHYDLRDLLSYSDLPPESSDYIAYSFQINKYNNVLIKLLVIVIPFLADAVLMNKNLMRAKSTRSFFPSEDRIRANLFQRLEKIQEAKKD